MVVDRMVPCAETRMFSGGKQKRGLEKLRMPLQMTKINELNFNVLEIAELRRRITYPCRLGCNQCSYRNAHLNTSVQQPLDVWRALVLMTAA